MPLISRQRPTLYKLLALTGECCSGALVGHVTGLGGPGTGATDVSASGRTSTPGPVVQGGGEPRTPRSGYWPIYILSAL